MLTGQLSAAADDASDGVAAVAAMPSPIVCETTDGLEDADSFELPLDILDQLFQSEPMHTLHGLPSGPFVERETNEKRFVVAISCHIRTNTVPGSGSDLVCGLVCASVMYGAWKAL